MLIRRSLSVREELRLASILLVAVSAFSHIATSLGFQLYTIAFFSFRFLILKVPISCLLPCTGFAESAAETDMDYP